MEKHTWTIDPSHSEVQFKIKHLLISTVTGQFTDYTASLDTIGKSLENATASFEAKIASISTNNADRDAHLRSADFFDESQFPTMNFQSIQITQNGEKLTVDGDLTIKDVTKRITLTGEFGGTMADFYGNVKAGLELNGSINRKDFGLTWSAVTEAGGVVVSDEVKLLLNLQFSRPA